MKLNCVFVVADGINIIGLLGMLAPDIGRNQFFGFEALENHEIEAVTR